uniref:Uncharacterized protein n=1 Tax=Haptolina brevifila TaxID=156173 RepID=A0A7S2CCS0_9EUKA
MWPRLQLDVEGELVVMARKPRGEHASSHWHTVLPLLAASPRRVYSGDVVRLAGWIHLPSDADTSVHYALWADILRASALRKDPNAHAFAPPSPLSSTPLPPTAAWPYPFDALCSCASRACRRCLVEILRRCLLPYMQPVNVGLHAHKAGSQSTDHGAAGSAGLII